MTIMPHMPNELSIARARLTGHANADFGRQRLEASLSRVIVADILEQHEILLVGHMKVATPLSPRLPVSHFAAGLTEQLKRLTREALVDPVSGVPEGRALRFSNLDRYAAWLISNWLHPPSLQSRAFIVELLRGQSVEQWQRRVILGDGRRIVRLVRALAGRKQAAEWIRRQSSGDRKTLIQSLGFAFGFDPSPFQANSADNTREPVSVATPKQDAPATGPAFSRIVLRPEPTERQTVREIAKSIFRQSSEPLSDLSAESQAILLAAMVLADHPAVGASLTRGGWHSLAQLANDLPQYPVRSQSVPTVASLHHKNRFGRRVATPIESGQASVDKSTGHPETELNIGNPLQVISMANRLAPPAVDAKLGTFESVSMNHPRTPEIQGHGSALTSNISTRFGGLFFLINIFLALRLYPDFSAPLGRRLAPSPFWLLAQLGLHFFGGAFRRDPLFVLLKRHGHYGRLPENWKVQTEWLAREQQKGVLRPAFDGQTVFQWDTRGFVYSAQKAKHYSRKAVASRSVSAMPTVRKLPTDSDDRWVACLATFIRFRMARAASGLDISALRIVAKFDLADDRLNLDFALADLPLSIRMAGLDRNPGWLPSEGRSIMFNFS